MLSEFLDLARWAQWLSGLEREFIFLLALPFVVAIIGLWSAWSEKEQEEREPETGEPPAPRESRVVPERRQRIRRRQDLGQVAQHELR
jgi:hypothetical protein